MVLDPHHQPATGFGTGHYRQRTNMLSQSRPHKGGAIQPAHVAEEEEEEEVPGSQANEQSSSGQMGSWKYEAEQSQTSEDEDESAEEGAGVLGLMRRLQKPQAGAAHGAGM
jgi:hypothetical protein